MAQHAKLLPIEFSGLELSDIKASRAAQGRN